MSGKHGKDKKIVSFWFPLTTIAILDEQSRRTGYNRTQLVLKAIRMAGLQNLPAKAGPTPTVGAQGVHAAPKLRDTVDGE